MEKENKKPVTIDLGDLFKIDPDRIKPDIKHVHYSNIAFVQVNQRDVQIDFMQMPGIPEDGGSRVETARIYMSHYSASKLAETILGTLEKASESGALEIYRSDG